jgi:hypothetical protein
MKQADQLLQIIEDSTSTFANIPEAGWNAKPDSLKWSKKEILGHLVDSALTNLRRFIMTQYQPGEKIVYHQDEWVELQGYQQAELKELITLWIGLNRQIGHVIQRIPAEKLQLIRDTGKSGIEPHTLEYLIDDYLVHLQHHLAQITESRKQES